MLGLLTAPRLQANGPEQAGSPDPLRVSLITIAPGEVYWEHFGHNAILIEDARDGSAIMYNFGMFDFAQAGFMRNFIQGRMLYSLAAIPATDDLAMYSQLGRAVWQDVLRLSPAQKQQLQRSLRDNAKPENAAYRYDYYSNNCSTKVRDALDAVLGGALQSTSEVRSRGASYRSHSLRLAAPTPWLAIAIDLGTGPKADRALSFWQEGFLPEHLRQSVLPLQHPDGTPVVSASQQLLPQRAPIHATAWFEGMMLKPTGLWIFALLGVIIAAPLYWAARQRDRASTYAPARTRTSAHRPAHRPAHTHAPSHMRARTIAHRLAAIIQLLIGMVGVLLLYLWLGTDHQIAWRNQNLFVFNPLALLLVYSIWQGRSSKTIQSLAIAGLVLAILGIIAKFSLHFPQDNWRWLLLLTPWHVAVWRWLKFK